MVALVGVCSFRGTPFDLDDADWLALPLYRAGEPLFAAAILIYSEADYTALLGGLSLSTWDRAIGTFAGVERVGAGPGMGTLRLPTGAGGALQNFDATLIEFAGFRHPFEPSFFRADATWRIATRLRG